VSKKKVSPQVQAALTRKKRAKEKARAAKLRSERARYAALVRWGKIVPIRPKVQSSKKSSTKKPPVKSKKKPGPKKLVGVERLQRDLENEKRRRRRAEKKYLEEKAHAKARNEQVKKFIQYQTPKRFTDISKLPERMKKETDRQYARRLVNQVMREGFFQADQAYGPIAEAARLSSREVYTLFMSPEVA
jgi:hypothetical protein